MKKKEIIDFAINFKNLIENEHDLKVDSLQAIADIGFDYECGDQEGTDIPEIPEGLFVKGLTALITAKVLQLTKLEVRWDELTGSPLIKFGDNITNIQEDLVKTYGEGRCRYNIAWFLNSVLSDVDEFDEVYTEAPLALSAPGVSAGNYNLSVDELIDKKLEFLEDVVRGCGFYGEGSCVILSMEEMDKIGDLNQINVFDEFWKMSNPELSDMSYGVFCWFVGWVLYDEDGFSLLREKMKMFNHNEPNLTDGYDTFYVKRMFDDLLVKRANGNPFKVVKPLYEHMMSVKRANREKAWLFASNI